MKTFHCKEQKGVIGFFTKTVVLGTRLDGFRDALSTDPHNVLRG